MAKTKAKLVRKIENGGAWYFDKYELECIECGTRYLNGRYDCRTSPYCVDCRRKRDKERTQILKEQKRKQIERKIWNSAVDKTAETIKELYSLTIDEENMIDEAVMKIKH